MAVFPAAVTISTPFTEKIQFQTIKGSAGNTSRYLRKRRMLFPKRQVTLSFDTKVIADIETLFAFFIARAGGFETFTYFFPRTSIYVKEYVGVGDGVTTVFDTPSKTASSVTVYVDNVAKTGGGTDYTLATGGSDGGDKITFVVAPDDGAKILMSFTGYYRLRAYFAQDSMDFDTFYQVLGSTGLVLQGVLNDE